MAKPTKSQKIMALYDGTLTTREIAWTVGCDPAYVRVVARQRKGGAESAIDLRYRKSPLGRMMIAARARIRYASNPEYRARKNWLAREWARKNLERRRASNRKAYNSRKQREASRAQA